MDSLGRRLRRRWLAALAAGVLATGRSLALEIADVAVGPGGGVTVRFQGDPGSYYVLFRGDQVGHINLPASLVLGVTGMVALQDPPTDPGRPAQFYRVREIPKRTPVDVDADGLDDLYELGAGGRLDPVDSTDAAADPDGDGRTTLQEYRDGTDPFVDEGRILATVAGTSPADFESGVSVHREVVLQFSRPLAQGTELSTERLFARVGSRRLLGRAELSGDRRAATLFHLEPMPGATRVSVVLDGSGLLDDRGQPLDADGDGLPGGARVLAFDTFGNAAVPGTAVIGHVFASELGTNDLGQPINRPLEGVIVTVDGAEERLRAVTDAEGKFTLSPAPSGRFFVHVDGRLAVGSAWPNGAYYPFVGKAWSAVPGKTNNLAGGSGLIFLPLVPAGALQPVSGVQDTRITFPAETLARHPHLAGVEIQVPANSLYHDSGQRGGRIGLAPVPPDRLPEPLPPGLEMPLVITIQTDGPANFDRPVPVRFPNLPDPTTGRKLPPGAKTALISFNHDLGTWEVAGSMTITPDGQFAVTDPGVGVRQPGWHGTSPLCSGSGAGYGNEDPDLRRRGRGQSGEGGAAGGDGGLGGAGAGRAGGDDDDDTVEPEDRDGPDEPEGDPPAPEFGNEGVPANCNRADFEDPDSVLFLKPLPRGSGGLVEDEFVAPRPEQVVGPGVYTDVLGNQHILLDIGFEPDARRAVAWFAPSGTPTSGSGRVFRVRFPLNHGLSHRKHSVCFEVVTAKDDGTDERHYARMEFRVLPNSGAHFASAYQSPKDPADLEEPFRSSVIAFLAAVKDAGVEYEISTIRRQQKRAYLMRFSDIVATGTRARNNRPAVPPGRFEDIPPYNPADPRITRDCDGSDGCVGPLPISWAHLDANGRIDREATIAAAMALFSKYNIVSRAAFPSSRHGLGKAIDVSFSNWAVPKSFRLARPIQLPDGSFQTHTNIAPVQCFKISCDDGPTRAPVASQHCNEAFRQLGHEYGVFKLECDMPHWEYPDPTP